MMRLLLISLAIGIVVGGITAITTDSAIIGTMVGIVVAIVASPFVGSIFPKR